ncbi:MAG: hybrid sensor histidine kinase/response regulator [Sideroxydans sp.]|nr:hybrid sensor histidine kinase/response regulator [Sideroxydans sp.]
MKFISGLLRFDINADNLAVRREQVRARIAMYPTMLGSQMLLAVLLTWMMWEKVSHEAMIGWVALVFTMHLIEFVQWWLNRDCVEDMQCCRKWDKRFKLHTSLAAAVWGGGWTIVFVPGDVGSQALIICVAMGLSAGAVTINPVHRPAFFLYLAFLLTPLIFLVAWEGDQQHWLLALMLVIYVVFLIDAGIKLMNTFEASLLQRFENQALLVVLRTREDEIAKALAVAEQANQAKTKFMATASHDLRQPLQALRLFTDTLQGVVHEPVSVRLAGQIEKSVNSLVEMFDDLLDVSRFEAGVIEPRLQSFAVFRLFDRLYDDFAPLAESKGLILELPNCDGQPAIRQSCGVIVHSDPFLLERMLRNLIANAIRYTERGKVTLGCRCEDEKVEFVVHDTGIGISEANLEKIFDEYFQVGNPNRDRRHGLGLGLAIVRRVEQLLGCVVKVESTLGKGSTFSFSLDKGEMSELAMPFGIAKVAEDISGKLVAYVEDDVDIREFTTELLQDWGCDVVRGDSGSALMVELEHVGKRPDILLCDYRLPSNETAVDVMRLLRQSWSDVPVLVVTGDTGADTLKVIKTTGASLLHKPVSPDRLRSVLHISMSHSQA